MTEKRKGGERRGKLIGVTVDWTLYEELKRLAGALDLTPSTLVRQLLEESAGTLAHVYKAAMAAKAGKVGKAARFLKVGKAKALRQLDFEEARLTREVAPKKKSP